MTKLDPSLLAAVERIGLENTNSDEIVQVLVGLSAPLDEAMRADLAARGLEARTEAGDVLTGSVPLRSVAHLAESPSIIRIEASKPLFQESSGGGEG